MATEFDAKSLARTLDGGSPEAMAEVRRQICDTIAPRRNSDGPSGTRLTEVLEAASPVRGAELIASFSALHLGESPIPANEPRQLNDALASAVDHGQIAPVRLDTMYASLVEKERGSLSHESSAQFSGVVGSLRNSEQGLAAKDSLIRSQLQEAAGLRSVEGRSGAAVADRAHGAEVDAQASSLLASEPPGHVVQFLASLPPAERTAFVQGALDGEARSGHGGIERVMADVAHSNEPTAAAVGVALFKDVTDVYRPGSSFEEGRRPAEVEQTREGLRSGDTLEGNGFGAALNALANAHMRPILADSMTAGSLSQTGVERIDAYVSIEARGQAGDAANCMHIMGHQVTELTVSAATGPDLERAVQQRNADLGSDFGRVRSAALAGQLTGVVQGSLSNSQVSVERAAEEAKDFRLGIKSGLELALAATAMPEAALLTHETRKALELIKAGFEESAESQRSETGQIRSMAAEFRSATGALRDGLPGDMQRAFDGEYGAGWHQPGPQAQSDARPGARRELGGEQLASLQSGIASAGLPAAKDITNWHGGQQTGTPIALDDRTFAISAGRGAYAIVDADRVPPEAAAQLAEASRQQSVVQLGAGGAGFVQAQHQPPEASRA